jgi:hypothetical protein
LANIIKAVPISEELIPVSLHQLAEIEELITQGKAFNVSVRALKEVEEIINNLIEAISISGDENGIVTQISTSQGQEILVSRIEAQKAWETIDKIAEKNKTTRTHYDVTSIGDKLANIIKAVPISEKLIPVSPRQLAEIEELITQGKRFPASETALEEVEKIVNNLASSRIAISLEN